MNRKQFFIAVFSALIGAKRWRKWFAPKRSMLVSNAWLPSISAGSLFNPTVDVAAQWRNAPLQISVNKMYSFEYSEKDFDGIFKHVRPKIGDTINVRTPARRKVSAVNVAA